jgi:hypothetical protein
MVIDPMNPERKRPRYYEDYQMNLASRPQNLVPQFSQLNVTPQYGVTRLGGNGEFSQLMDRGSVTPSGYPDSNRQILDFPHHYYRDPNTHQLLSSHRGGFQI